MKGYRRALTKEHVDAQEIGLIEAAIAEWEIKYPGADGMIQENYVERLELKRDGTFTWNPPPLWALERGEWGVIKTQDGLLKLGFTDRDSRWRWNYLVLMKIGKSGEYFLNWQRTRGDAVYFGDRILRADRLDAKG